MDILYYLQGIRTPILNGFFNVFTYFGSEILVIAVLCIIYWCLNKTLAYKLAFTYLFSGLTVQGLKTVFRINRPWIQDERLFCDKTALEGATGYSFPSGHTQGVTGLFSTLAMHFKKVGVSIVCYVIIALVMFARMYLGCHTLQDVLVAFGITFITSIIVELVFSHFKSTKATRILVLIVTELLAIAVIINSLYVVNTDKSTLELTLDSFKAAGTAIGFGIGWFIERNYINFDPKKAKNIWIQIIKFVVGIGAVLLIKWIIKKIFGESIPIAIIRYAFVGFWIVGLYPLILKKVLK